MQPLKPPIKSKLTDFHTQITKWFTTTGVHFADPILFNMKQQHKTNILVFTYKRISKIPKDEQNLSFTLKHSIECKFNLLNTT